MNAELQTKVQASPAQNFTPVQTGLLQKKCALCNTPGLAEDSGRDKEKLTLQRSLVDQGGTTTVPPIVSRLGHDFSKVNVYSTGRGMIQTKLKINEPEDPYEQEADRVADQVMRMPEPRPQLHVEPEEEIQAKLTSGQVPHVSPVLQNKIHSLRGGGQPLSSPLRNFFEPRFGHDFSRVRVHNDAQAEESARSLSARAYTVGRDIMIGSGQYLPDSVKGKQLLAHELTHVIQQGHGGGAITRGSSGSGDYMETEAKHIGDAIVTGSPIQIRGSVSQATLQLSPLSDELTDIWQISRGNKGRIFDRLREVSPVPDDSDVTSYLNQIFGAGTDDLWLALAIQQNGPEPLWPRQLFDERGRRALRWAPEPGHIGANLRPAGTTGLPVMAYYFRGLTDQRALIIGGVHGSEQSGVEVANMLVDSLRTGPRPHFTVIIVPVLFPANLAAAQAASPAPRVDPIYPGRMTPGPGHVDPNRQLPAVGQSLATARRRGGARGPVDAQNRPIEPENIILMTLIDRFRPTRIASVHAHSMRGRARRGRDMPGIFGERSDPTDDALALAMAGRAARSGARVPGNWLGTATPEPDYPPSAPRLHRGTTLGMWASHPIAEGGPQDRPAMTIITVEVQHYHPSSAETTRADQVRRLSELEAHRDALREIFLGPPSP